MNTYHISVPESAYIHGNEVNQFIHIQVPMELVVAECFSGISGEAKILYGLLLNRTGLSIRNGWEDEWGRTYINYSIADVMEDLHISHSKASRLFSELTNIIQIQTEDKAGREWFGLVEKVRVMNKPSRIYVHKVADVKRILDALAIQSEDIVEEDGAGQIAETFDKENAPLQGERAIDMERISDEKITKENDGMRIRESEDLEDKSENGTKENTPGSQILPQKCPEPLKNPVVPDIGRRSSQIQDDGRPRYRTTVVSDIGRRSSQKWDENNNKYINKNNINNYGRNHHPSIPPGNSSEQGGSLSVADGQTGVKERMENIRQTIREQIGYKYLVGGDLWQERKKIDMMVEVMVETSVLAKTVRISGMEIPHEVIRDKFEKIDYDMVRYILERMKESNTRVRNMKNYILTMLFNAPDTISSFYEMEAQYDLRNPRDYDNFGAKGDGNHD